MILDYKCTVWRRIHIPDDVNDEKYIIETLKKGLEPLLEASEYETLYDTSEEMTVEDNDGQSTIDLYNSDYELLFKNEK